MLELKDANRKDERHGGTITSREQLLETNREILQLGGLQDPQGSAQRPEARGRQTSSGESLREEAVNGPHG